MCIKWPPRDFHVKTLFCFCFKMDRSSFQNWKKKIKNSHTYQIKIPQNFSKIVNSERSGILISVSVHQRKFNSVIDAKYDEDKEVIQDRNINQSDVYIKNNVAVITDLENDESGDRTKWSI